MKTLGELLDSIDRLDPSLTIYAPAARPLSADSPAAVGEGADGLVYLLEVALAVDAIEVWTQWRQGRQPSTADRIAAVVFYADNDAYLPIETE